MIKFEQVSKTYPGGQRALSKVNFHIEPGEMAFLTGHSGAGKSTLLKLISIMERPTVGRVLINGHDLNTITRRQIAFIRRDIGMIFQNHHLLMDKSVFDNVALPLIIEGYTRKETSRRVEAALEMVGLSQMAKNSPLMLSGGEQQRVGIARAVVNKPPLLLADEPTGNLDPKLSMEIISLFEDFNQAGVSVFIATHDLGLIARMRYRTLTLRNGQMITDGLNEKEGAWQ
ncbi:cell division ATP-binding protein FtsE [Alteromonas sp. ASW11-130]|uniref:cell division ATP-binding protein FtsE n=1 Tax=Alteromonas sp. ASW11-130 TaxID=3015775 RepID=UPI00224276A7|nr:cell division ATP-binding protein FtsE [Alteromonas sp. ASW11-130]MCW8091940.1 cell division ATP-binding protein FtsE [Alteromonas sp. ASW11-130]